MIQSKQETGTNAGLCITCTITFYKSFTKIPIIIGPNYVIKGVGRCYIKTINVSSFVVHYDTKVCGTGYWLALGS